MAIIVMKMEQDRVAAKEILNDKFKIRQLTKLDQSNYLR